MPEDVGDLPPRAGGARSRRVIRGGVGAVYLAGRPEQAGPVEGELAVAGGILRFGGSVRSGAVAWAPVEIEVPLNQLTASSLEEAGGAEGTVRRLAVWYGLAEGLGLALAARGPLGTHLLAVRQRSGDGGERTWAFALGGIDGRMMIQAIERIVGELPAVPARGAVEPLPQELLLGAILEELRTQTALLRRLVDRETAGA